MKNLSLKTLALGILALFAVTTVSAQEEPAKKKNKFGLANRVGVGVGYGTEGLGFDVAIPLTQYVQVRAGLNIFPNIKFHEDIDVEYVGETPLAGEQTIEDKVRLDAKFGRTYADSPDIDGRVVFTSEAPVKVGTFVPVEITGAAAGDLTGKARKN